MQNEDTQLDLSNHLADLEASDSATSAPPASFRPAFTLLRADDLLELDIALIDFTLVKTATGYELQTTTGGTIIMTLPPQHILEGINTQPSKPVFVSRSQIRFRVPANAAPIPLSIAGILAATANCELLVDTSLPGAALFNDTGGTTPALPTTPLPKFPTPSTIELTQLCVSGRVGLTPRSGAMRFRHASGMVAHNGAVELWHTRLAQRTTSGNYVERKADLVGTRLHVPTGTISPQVNVDEWSAAIKAVKRLPNDESIELDVINQSRQAPGSLRTRQLILSSLGAWADLRGNWSDTQTVKSWQHEVAVGRDQTHRTAIKGRMYPFGHEAVMENTIERNLAGKNGRRARLQQRSQITILDDVVSFNSSDSVGRQFPFREIELLTTTTPNAAKRIVDGTSAVYFVRGSQNRPFAYRCRAIDLSGRTIRFNIPLIFVPNGFTDFAKLKFEYDKLVNQSGSHFIAKLNGQRTAIAPPGGAGSDVILQLAKLTHQPGGSSGFRPVVREMVGWVPGIEDFGNDARSLVMRYATEYVTSAFGSGNLGEVLLQIDAAPTLKLVDPQSVSGLMSQLNLTPRGYSRALGPVAGSLANAALQTFDPADFLGDALKSMKLLGVFDLSPLLSTVNTLQHAPQIIAKTIDGARTQSFAWTTPLFTGNKKSVSAAAGRLRSRAGQQASLNVRSLATFDPQTMQVHASTMCSINNVEAAIVVAGQEFVIVPLESITFKSANGQSPDVDVVLGEIGFGGVLRYVRQLTKLIDRSGFTNANAIEILPDAVSTSFSLPVPAIAVGMFVLENISFGARFELPFSNRVPRLDLNFSSFENPFRLTVLAIGGGGHVRVGVDMEGRVNLDAALEFGAAVSLNLGIAKASVSIMGGIFFVFESGDFTITGYLRVNGRAEILGIASVSVELYVGLTYIPHENAVLGEAQIVATVRVLFAKKTFRIPFKKKFGGSNSNQAALAAGALVGTTPPGFADAMDPVGWVGDRPWKSYCEAFAA